MKKYLFILILCPMIVCGQQQKGGGDDSLKISVKALRNILIAAEQSKVLKEQVNVLNQRISGYEQIIANLNQKDSATVEGYRMEIKTMNEEKIIFLDQIAELNKIVRREKRKRFWTSVGGTFTTVAALFLFVTKK